MIIWTPYGILTWITVRLSLIVFYSILAFYVYEKHKTIFNNPLKNLLYSVFFISMIVGIWELPLFIFRAEQDLQWAFNDILYTIPFPVICYIFNIHFSFSKKELVLFGVWCIIASVYAYINIIAYNNWGLIGHYDFDYDITYVCRIITFIFFFLIFRRIKIYERK